MLKSECCMECWLKGGQKLKIIVSKARSLSEYKTKFVLIKKQLSVIEVKTSDFVIVSFY